MGLSHSGSFHRANLFTALFTGTHGQGIDREIFLDVKTGVEAKNYDDVSTKDQ